tara:strand:- start:21528 stop:22745 length:1218 start_codon:yes stop_codon:yes gene_type:complete
MQAGIFALLALLVFVLPPALGDIGTALILGLAAILGVGFLARAVKNPAKPDIVSLMFIAAFCLMAIAFIVSAQVPGDIRFALNFIPLLLALPVLQLLGKKPSADFTRIAILAGCGAVLAAAIAGFQIYVLDQGRAGSHIINAIHFSNVSITLGLFSLAGVLLVRERFAAIFLVPLGCAVFACVLAASRGPLLAVAAVLPVFLIVLNFHSKRLALFLTIAIAVVTIVGFAALEALAPGQLARVQNMVTVIPDALFHWDTEDNSTNIRLGLLGAGFEAFKDAPWFGHGWGSIISATHPHMGDWLFSRAEGFDYLHNEPLDFAVGAGIPGVMAYMLILLAPIAGVVSFSRDQYFLTRMYLAIMLAVSFFVFGLTSRLLGQALQLTLFAFLTAYVVGYARNVAHVRSNR